MIRSILKWFLIIPSLLFLDLIIMIVFGCFSSICGASNDFYCTIYCRAGIALLVFTLLLLIYLIVKSYFPKLNNKS
jgi:hypothetical protein